jgi:hypothetical protein
MQLQWLSMIYWNKLVSDKACSELLICTIAANVHQGITANLPCWSKELLAALVFVAPDHDWKSDILALKQIAQPKAVLDLARGAFSRSIQAFDQDPTDPNCTTRQRSSYCRWMYRAPVGQLTAPAYLKHNVPVHKKQAVARCRLGGAPIRANTHSSPYRYRICIRLLSDEGLNAARLRSLVRNVVGAKYFPHQRADLVLLQRFRVMPDSLLGAR